MLHMENPATLAACGVPERDLAGASIYPESKSPTFGPQASREASNAEK
jgi:hypothetical protein